MYSIHPENAKGERRSEGGGQLRQSRNLSRLSWANPVAKSKSILLPPEPFQLDSIEHANASSFLRWKNMFFAQINITTGWVSTARGLLRHTVAEPFVGFPSCCVTRGTIKIQEENRKLRSPLSSHQTRVAPTNTPHIDDCICTASVHLHHSQYPRYHHHHQSNHPS